MNNRELNQKFMKAFGLDDTDKLLIQSFTVSFTGDEYPVVDVRYVNTKNIIDGELEEVLKSFKLQEDILSHNIE